VKLLPKSKISKFFSIIIFLIITVQLWLNLDPKVVINSTTSMPVGIYYRTDHKCCSKDDIVLIDTRKLMQTSEECRQGVINGYISEEYNLLKRIVGVKGDIVILNNLGITINNSLLRNSKPLTHDSQNRTVMHNNLENRMLLDREYIVKGDSSKSFDSRYFGIVKQDEIITTVKPIFTLNVE